jgi:hypothetical protein
MKGEQTIWSGPVTVRPNERVIIFVDQDGKQVVKPWAEGSHLSALPRFKAGIASATIVVAPVSGTFNAQPTQINCNNSVRLSWNTQETLHAYLTSEPAGIDEEVPVTGERELQPKLDTKYTLRAVGPGGVVTNSVLVRVNPVVQALITSFPMEPAHYIRVGNKILNEDTTTFKYFVDNADEILLDKLGTVPAIPAKLTVGERTFTPVPNQTAEGLVNE